ncbi:hypothetical protein SFRURICE_005769 [Spodoptera frugiperda]|nr:hypothetical protein SFRURICE_005769 [Spodoptera frugiperda]
MGFLGCFVATAYRTSGRIIPKLSQRNFTESPSRVPGNIRDIDLRKDSSTIRIDSLRMAAVLSDLLEESIVAHLVQTGAGRTLVELLTVSYDIATVLVKVVRFRLQVLIEELLFLTLDWVSCACEIVFVNALTTRHKILEWGNFMKKEKEEGAKDLNKVYLRVANATGVSQRTVHRIATEGNVSGSHAEFRTPGKTRPRAKPVTGLDSFHQGIIKRCIHNFYKTEKEMPTMNKLLAKLKRDINYQGCSTSLRTIVENLGFKRRKPENNRWVLIENTDVRLKRILYLKAIKKYRDEGRPIVFVDESYVRSSHTKSKAWSDGSAQGLKRPISNVQGIVMVHAGSETGFVPNTLLMYKSGTKTEDFNGMNFEIYEKWVRTQLIPNLSPNSVVVEDEYRKSDHIIDELTEQIIINTASDSESESEIESDNYSEDEPMSSDKIMSLVAC